MQLTKHTDFAFRVLIYLAGIQEERATIQAISEVFDVSKTHLMKVVSELVNKGWIDSTRGKNGGICLGVDASDLSLNDVIIHMEKTLEPINCDTPMCHIQGVCLLKPLLMQAQNEYLKHLAQYSLADLINPRIVKRLSFERC